MAKTTFQSELRELLNKHSKEGCSDTPDFILAIYLNDCLEAFNKATNRRAQFFNNSDTVDTEIIEKEGK